MKKVLLVLTSILAIAACGSSGSSDDAATIADFQTISIQTSNSEQVASVVTNAMFDGIATTVPDMLFGVDTSAKITVQDFVSLDNLQSILKSISNLSSNDTVSGIKRSEKVNCDQSGSMTVESYAASSSFITKGDYIKTQLNKCDQGFGIRSGSLIITFLEDASSNKISGFGEYQTSIQLTFNQFSVSADAISAVGDGVFTLYIESDSDSHISVVSTEEFSMRTTSSEHKQVLSNFKRTAQIFYHSGEMRMGSSGTIGDSLLDGQIFFNLDIPFDFYSELADAPYSGKLKITGENSILWLTAQSHTSVLLELDPNADGVITSSETLNWSDLH